MHWQVGIVTLVLLFTVSTLFFPPQSSEAFCEHAPRLNPIEDQIIMANEVVNLVFQASAPDCPGPINFKWDAVGLPSFATWIDNGGTSTSLRLEPKTEDVGEYEITIIVSIFNNSKSDFDEFTITVIVKDEPPEILPINDQIVNEGEILEVPFSISYQNVNDLLIETSGLPNFAKLNYNGDGKGTLMFGPSFEDSGIYPEVTIIARDGSLEDSETFELVVVDVNRAPNAIDDNVSTIQGNLIEINVMYNDFDLDGDALTVDSALSPSNGILKINSGNTITYTPEEGFHGIDSFTYTITDGDLNDVGTVTISVKGAIMLIEEKFDILQNSWTCKNRNLGCEISSVAKLFQLLSKTDKVERDEFKNLFHKYKDAVKEILVIGQSNSKMWNELKKSKLELEMKLTKIDQKEFSENKIQTGIDLSKQKKELIDNRNHLGIIKLSFKDGPEKNKKMQELNAKIKNNLKNVMITKAKHNDEKITLLTLKQMDEKISEIFDQKKSKNDKGDSHKKNEKKDKGNNKGGKKK